MNTFVFCVEGWDNDTREIHLIPEIRRFYSTFHDAWPHWLYPMAFATPIEVWHAASDRKLERDSVGLLESDSTVPQALHLD